MQIAFSRGRNDFAVAADERRIPSRIGSESVGETSCGGPIRTSRSVWVVCDCSGPEGHLRSGHDKIAPQRH